MPIDAPDKSDHDILSFENDIITLPDLKDLMKMPEGTYKWDGRNWVKQ